MKQDSILLVDKPEGWTSFDVCNKIRFTARKALGLRKFKVGHSGTLDPLATGLLIIATGKKTKTLHDMQGLDKVYSGTIRLGAITASLDREHPEEDKKPVDHIEPEAIHEAFAQMTGEIQQMPPVFSAVKVKGKRAYKAARQNQDIQLEARKVVIHSLKIQAIEMPFVHFECHCSKGTYIRSIARDIGETLGVGGYLYALRRTQIGEFNIDNADSIEEHLERIKSWNQDQHIDGALRSDKN